MKNVAMRISEEDYAKLREISKTTGLSMSKIVSHAFRELLKVGAITISESWTWREKA